MKAREVISESLEREQAKRFPTLAPNFQKYIVDLSQKHNKPTLYIYGLWCEYSGQCFLYDQSPVQFQFEDWYKKQLTS